MLRTTAYAATVVLATALPSVSEVFICGDEADRGDHFFAHNDPLVARKPTPPGALLSCSCRWKFPNNYPESALITEPEVWQCMTAAVVACNDASDQEMCRANILSLLEDNTLIDVTPVSFIDFATRINFALLAKVEEVAESRKPTDRPATKGSLQP